MLKVDERGQVVTEQATTEERRVEFKAGAWLMGVADWIGHDGVVWRIDDLKTGREPPCEQPSDLAQKLWYADCWLDLHRREPGLELTITHWPRYPKGELPTIIGPEYVERDFVKRWHHEKLLPASELARRPGAKDDARPGPWCQYCRCEPYCPAHGGI